MAPLKPRGLRTLPAVVAGAIASVLAPSVALAQDAPVPKELLAELPAFNDIFLSVLIIVVAFFLARIATGTLDKIGDRFATRRLLLKKIASLSRFLLYLLATLLIVLGVIQPEAQTLTALITASAVMIGFAFKDLAGSIIAGVIILIDAPFQVGDRVQFGDTYGEVTEIGLRVVQITTLDDNLVSIPNNKFLTEVVASANAGALDMMIQMDFHIGVNEDFSLAKRLAYEATITSKFVFLDKPVVVLVEDVSRETSFATRIRTKFYVIDVRFESAVRTDVTERLKTAFALHNIKAPYHMQVERLAVDAHVSMPVGPVSDDPNALPRMEHPLASLIADHPAGLKLAEQQAATHGAQQAHSPHRLDELQASVAELRAMLQTFLSQAPTTEAAPPPAAPPSLSEEPSMPADTTSET